MPKRFFLFLQVGKSVAHLGYTDISKSRMADTLKDKTAKGLLWGGLNTFLQQLLNLVFGIILARKLSQDDYGMVGMLAVFTGIAGSLQDGGFVSALNKRKNITFDDYNSVFWFNVTVAFVCYWILFFCAPLIADFYGEPELVWLSRYCFLGFFITSLNIAPRAYLFRNLKAKENSTLGLVALIVSGIVGIVMAANGFAYWGLATQSNVFVLVITIMSYYYSGFRPKLTFSFQPIREMFGFGSKLVVTSICNVVNNNLFSVILGKFYTSADVGNFTQANKWNNLGHNTITNMLYGVAQPVFTKVDDERGRQKRVFRKLLRFTALLAFPAMFGLSLTANELIVITITEKWLTSASILSLLCIWGAFIPINSLLSNLIISRGRSGTYMWCTIGLIVVSLATVLVMAYLKSGMWNMLVAFVIVNILWMFVWHYFAKREIGISLFEMLRDMAPYALLSMAVCAGAFFAFSGISNVYLAFVLKFFSVAIVYCTILWLSGSVIFKECVAYFFRKKR